jgi:exoribonuclease R
VDFSVGRIPAHPSTTKDKLADRSKHLRAAGPSLPDRLEASVHASKVLDVAAKDTVMSCVRTYRESMVEFSRLKTLEQWCRVLTADELIASLEPDLRRRAMKRIQKKQAKSRSEKMFPKLVEHRGDMPIIKDQLPTIFHAEGHPPGEIQKVLQDAFNTYRDSLPHSSQSLLDRYELRDAAIKVVGVGSVGTACWV